MAYSTPEEDDFLSTARDRFTQSAEAENELRELFLSDLRFYSGEQWPDNVKWQRELDKRPCLTLNRMQQFCHQVTNEIRQNKPAPNVSPVDDGGDKETAEIFQGLIRHIERQSKADTARSYAAFYAVVAGRGYYRIVCEYADPRGFDQEVYIRRIKNPMCVYMDPHCQEPDYSDARYCFVVEDMTKDEFKAQYPDAKDYSAEDFRSIGDSNMQPWRMQDTVRVAEYFTRSYESVPIAMLQDGSVLPLEQVPPGVPVVAQRTTQMPRVRWYKIDGCQILDQREWPGQWIPVVAVLGEEYDIDGKTQLSGMVRNAKDPQRMLNYWESAKTEMIALAPRTPYVVAEGQIENHEEEWAQSNFRNFAYVQYKPVSASGHPVPPPRREVYEPPIQAISMAEAGAVDALKAATGIYDASLGNRSNETSGIAIRQRQSEGDVANYHFIDNLTTAITHEGRILVDLIPKIYDRPGRVVRILGEDGSEKSVPVNAPFQRGQNGQNVTNQMQFNPQELTKFYDLSAGRYDIAVNVGPSYATKRQQSADSMLQFAQAAPQLLPQYADLLVKNMDFPGADAIADRIRPPGVSEEGEPPIPPQARQMIIDLQAQNQVLNEQLQQAQQVIDTNKLQIDSAERMQMRDIAAKRDLAEMKTGTDMTQTRQKIHGDIAQTESKIDSSENIAELNARVKLAAERMKQSQQQQQVRADIAQSESKLDSQENVAQLNADVKLTTEQMKQETARKRAEQQPRNPFNGGAD